MSPDLWRAAGWVIGACIGIVILGGVLGFARWALAQLASGAVLGVRLLLTGMAAGARGLSRGLQSVAAGLARLLWRLLRWVWADIADHGAMIGGAVRGWWSRVSATPGHAAPAGGMGRDESDEAAASGDAGERMGDQAYNDALKLMGLEAVRPLTSTILRARYREMIAVLHPDHGLPSSAFAQMLNEAVQTIKRVHGWR